MSTATSLVPANNFTVTITTFPEDDAIQDVTHKVISSQVLSFDYEASLPDPTDEYDEDELDGDGDVIASEDEFDEDDSHEAAVDEALDTLQDMISPEQLLLLKVTVTPAMISDLKAIYEAQDVGAATEILITYWSEYSDPLFHHIFTGYITPVRKLVGDKRKATNLVIELEMDVAEVRTFCLECPSQVKPTPFNVVEAE